VADPVEFCAGVLGKEPAEYAEWISRENSWGGAIELKILAGHFGVELAAFDLLTMRMDCYGFGTGASERGYLVYDGIHYDPMRLVIAGEIFVAMFPVADAGVEEAMRECARGMHVRREFSDVERMGIVCKTCGGKMKGEKQALEHAKATGHGDFAEA